MRITATATLTNQAEGPSENDGLLTALPTWEDEQAAYLARGIDTSSAQLDVEGMGWGPGERSNFEGYPGPNNIHDDTEGDEFWLAYWQPKRLAGSRPVAATTWANRLASVTPFFRSDYASQLTTQALEISGNNFDHQYGWGLCDHITDNSGDTTAINTLNAVMAILIEWNANDFVRNPGGTAVGEGGNGSRRWPRQLRLAVRAHEVSPLAAHLTWRDKVINIVLQDPDFVEADGYGIFSKQSSEVDNIVGAGAHSAGWRVMNTYHMGIMADALWNAWRVLFAEGDPRAATVMNRIVALAKFYRDVPLNSNGFIELLCGRNISTQAWLNTGGEGSPDGTGTYTTSAINVLVFAYKFTGDDTFLDRAWTLWMNRQEAESGQANKLHHYADSRTASALGHALMAYNKGELQYCYALFENGGDPILVPGWLPSWLPEFTAPGTIGIIPSSGSVAGGGNWSTSAFDEAVNARLGTQEDWTPPFTDAQGIDSLVGEGTLWPYHLTGYSGGCVAYIDGQPYLCICGGGHKNGPDNTIYKFGPLAGAGSNNPSWSKLSPSTTAEDIPFQPPPNEDQYVGAGDVGPQHYLDGRPSARHTAGDFSYGQGRIVMVWGNSPFGSIGGCRRDIDVYNIELGDWEAALGIPHTDTGDWRTVKVHGANVYVPATGLFYSLTGGRVSAYNATDVTVAGVPARSWADFGFTSGVTGGAGGDSAICIMGDEHGGQPMKVLGYELSGVGLPDSNWILDLQTRVVTAIGNDTQSGVNRGIGYDSRRERVYALASGSGPLGAPRNPSQGTRHVEWLDVNAETPVWTREEFNGVTPPEQNQAGTWGRWSYVPELRGFVYVGTLDRPVYFYRTAE